MSYYSNLKVGDKVYVECYTGMGASSTGEQTITAVKTKYDEDDGDAYTVIYLGKHKFDGRDGGAMNAPTMYYIEEQ